VTATLLPRRRAAAVLPAWLPGAAGLGYVIAAGVENMELLRAPLRGGAAADIRAAYADQALAAVTASAGVLSLLLYVVFATVLAPRLRWPGPALAAAVAGAALALAGIVVSAPLVLDGGARLTDAEVRSAFDTQQTLRLLAGPFMALFLFCAGSADAVPRRLARLACPIAVALALTPLAAVTGAQALQTAAFVAFGAGALWIWLASLWLLAGAGARPAVAVRRAAFLMLVVAAGLVGLALVIVPRSTGAFFAWELAPESLAAFAGGVYVGSAVLYAVGLRVSWREARALVAAAVVLSWSVLVITIVHLGTFDLGRLQAWAWIVLFAGFALATSALLVVGGGSEREGGVAPARRTRALLAVAAVALAAVGIGLWVDPGELPPLGGRFAGSWTVMLAVLAGWAAAVNRRDEARLPGLALVALPAGALVAAARTMEGDPAYVAGLVLLIACGVAVLRDTSGGVAGVVAGSAFYVNGGHSGAAAAGASTPHGESFEASVQR
jgi:hypothetical protein